MNSQKREELEEDRVGRILWTLYRGFLLFNGNEILLETFVCNLYLAV
jgi:hypothetical protein